MSNKLQKTRPEEVFVGDGEMLIDGIEDFFVWAFISQAACVHIIERYDLILRTVEFIEIRVKNQLPRNCVVV